ncbi:MOSC N-terminal beta barrel domain-containing protein [Streptomyces sp. NPDC059994]|uniref:MOSC N-terminal beta barrel domain-containing protein n=1 Tax=Streptomyces sp. NPDC059994 TaxID=3347029 RepID=UPI0036A12661
MRRYPVKSMLGEEVASARITERGVAGDRMLAVVGEQAAVGSAKHPRKWGALLGCRSRLDDGGAVWVRLPEGTGPPAGDAELDKRLSGLLGRRVSVSGTPPERGVLERMVPEHEGGVPHMPPSPRSQRSRREQLLQRRERRLAVHQAVEAVQGVQADAGAEDDRGHCLRVG